MDHMDPRIGILIREGTNVYYAFVNGYDAEPVEGTRAEVEVALGIREASEASDSEPAVAPEDALPPGSDEYIVTMRSKYPAWDETPGLLRVVAHSKSHANSVARAWAHREGLLSPAEGPVYFKAELAEDVDHEQRTSPSIVTI